MRCFTTGHVVPAALHTNPVEVQSLLSLCYVSYQKRPSQIFPVQRRLTEAINLRIATNHAWCLHDVCVCVCFMFQDIAGKNWDTQSLDTNVKSNISLESNERRWNPWISECSNWTKEMMFNQLWPSLTLVIVDDGNHLGCWCCRRMLIENKQQNFWGLKNAMRK